MTRLRCVWAANAKAQLRRLVAGPIVGFALLREIFAFIDRHQIATIEIFAFIDRHQMATIEIFAFIDRHQIATIEIFAFVNRHQIATIEIFAFVNRHQIATTAVGRASLSLRLSYSYGLGHAPSGLAGRAYLTNRDLISFLFKWAVERHVATDIRQSWTPDGKPR